MYHRDEWFYELSPSALSESEFESLLVSNANIIRMDTTLVPFKKTVHSAETSARADLAMIANDYRHWMVVEVEMLRHDLYRHVLPQVRTLREGFYDQDHAAYLAARNPHLDVVKLGEMLRGSPPDVLVIVNKFDEEWRRELARYGAHVMVFEIFRAQSNRHIFVIDGEPPKLTHDMLSELSFALLPRCLTVASPAALNFGVGEKIGIFIDDQLTFWERFQTATAVYLTPVGAMPIRRGQRYALARMANGHLTIRPFK